MSIEVDIIAGDEYVCLRCTGPCSLAEVKKVWSQAVDAALEHGNSRVLIDASGVTGDLSMIERYQSSEFLADEIMRRALGKIKKFAVCGNEPPLDPSRFGELVAVNRGVNAKVFTQLDEAIRWV